MKKTITVGKNLTHQEAVRKASSQLKVETHSVTYNPKTGKVVAVY